MVTIKDFIDNNENMMIQIEAAFSEDTTDPLRITVYEGMLADIPERLQGIEVIEGGWLIGAQMNCLTVLNSEVKKACVSFDKDGELAESKKRGR